MSQTAEPCLWLSWTDALTGTWYHGSITSSQTVVPNGISSAAWQYSVFWVGWDEVERLRAASFMSMDSEYEKWRKNASTHRPLVTHVTCIYLAHAANCKYSTHLRRQKVTKLTDHTQCCTYHTPCTITLMKILLIFNGFYIRTKVISTYIWTPSRQRVN